MLLNYKKDLNVEKCMALEVQLDQREEEEFLRALVAVVVELILFVDLEEVVVVVELNLYVLDLEEVEVELNLCVVKLKEVEVELKVFAEEVEVEGERNVFVVEMKEVEVFMEEVEV